MTGEKNSSNLLFLEEENSLFCFSFLRLSKLFFEQLTKNAFVFEKQNPPYKQFLRLVKAANSLVGTQYKS